MRKIIVLSFITLDGVIQAPGRPEEDTSGVFKYGGWAAPYFYEADEAAGEGTIPAAFTLTDSLVTPNGVIFANYKRAGEVKTGTIGS